MNKNIQIIIGLILLAFIVTITILAPQKTSQVEPETNKPELVNNSLVTEKLTSSVWVWKQTIMSDETVTIPNQAGSFTLTFTADGNMTGTTDCNNFFGPYTLQDTQITFGPIASTLMYCEGSQESNFTRQFENVQSVFFNENDNLVLLIKYDSGSIIFSKQE